MDLRDRRKKPPVTECCDYPCIFSKDKRGYGGIFSFCTLTEKERIDNGHLSNPNCPIIKLGDVLT